VHAPRPRRACGEPELRRGQARFWR
jgi:hypothetical protein